MEGGRAQRVQIQAQGRKLHCRELHAVLYKQHPLEYLPLLFKSLSINLCCLGESEAETSKITSSLLETSLHRTPNRQLKPEGSRSSLASALPLFLSMFLTVPITIAADCSSVKHQSLGQQRQEHRGFSPPPKVIMICCINQRMLPCKSHTGQP